MTQEKMYKMVSKIMVMAVLMMGLFFILTKSTAAQEVCKMRAQLLTEEADKAEREKARDCWVKKAKSGEK